jgi:hypothetical protein
MRRSLTGVALAATILLVAAGCSKSSSTSSTTTSRSRETTTTTAGNKSFQVSTQDGEVSLSLDGQLPPNWPTSFPVPSDAKVAGSGSLGGSSKTVQVGVYDTSGSPQDAYNFYKDSTAYTVDSSQSVGLGSRYVGTVKFSGAFAGRVTIISNDSTARIVIVLESAGTGTTTSTSSGSSTSTTAGSSTTAASTG